MANRRNSKWNERSRLVMARLWEIRYALLIALSYLLVFGWLFAGKTGSDIRPGEVFVIPDAPLWEKPDQEHWFGTTGTGTDLFQLSRVAMASTLAMSVVASGLGVALTFLIVMMFAFDPGDRRFSLLKSVGSTGALLPAMVVVVILAGGSGGDFIVTVVSFALLLALHLSPIVAGWFEQGEERVGNISAYVLGLTRSDIVKNRIIPGTLRRLIGAFVCFIPLLALAEMSLAFLGFADGRLSCGSLVSFGREVIIEAPWMAIYPGILAASVVFVFALLGWLSARLLKTGNLPRWI